MTVERLPLHWLAKELSLTWLENSLQWCGWSAWAGKMQKRGAGAKDQIRSWGWACSAEPRPGAGHISCEALVEWWSQPMSGVRSRSRWETPGGGWKVNFCMRLVKNKKSSILASDSPAHIRRPGVMDMMDGYKMCEQKNLKRNLDKDESCPHGISPILECVNWSL